MLVKTLFGLAVVAGVTLHFYRILDDDRLKGQFTRFDWSLLFPAALLYLACHTLWGTFWWQLLRQQSQPVPWHRGISTYFVSQFGKYVPGKVWVILLRMAMLAKYHTSRAVVFVTGIFESLTSIAAGALLGVATLPSTGIKLPEGAGTLPLFALLGGVPLGIVGLVRLGQRIVKRRNPSREMVIQTPSVPILMLGLFQACFGWCFLALSLSLVIRAVRPGEADFSAHEFLANLASVALSYVAGFVILVSPGGLGIREWVLAQLIAIRWVEVDGPVLAEGRAVVVAILLRLVWTVAEVIVAGGFWLNDHRRRHDTP
ncbi:lysylphosphatidylglycerol synthase transmembrane domain-containing protein [soil metagenome]